MHFPTNPSVTHPRCPTYDSQHERNGLVFDTSDTLAVQIQRLVDGFPNGAELRTLRDGVKTTVRWDANWRECARQVLVEGSKRSSALPGLLFAAVFAMLGAAVATDLFRRLGLAS